MIRIRITTVPVGMLARTREFEPGTNFAVTTQPYQLSKILCATVVYLQSRHVRAGISSHQCELNSM